MTERRVSFEHDGHRFVAVERRAALPHVLEWYAIQKR